VRRVFLSALCATVAVAVLMPSTSSAGLGLRFFHTVDNNIACGIIKGQKKRRKHRKKIPRIPGEARCDVRTHTWVAPPKPANCPLDWGNGVVVGDRGNANYVCAGDTVADATAPAAGPGSVIALGRYSCTVLEQGVRCTNIATGRGFEVSSASVSLF
jgi:uncharacterized protein DUF6636